MNKFSEKANFIWSVADLLRDALKRGKYQDVILPFTMLRRIDCILQRIFRTSPCRAGRFLGKRFDRFPRGMRDSLLFMTEGVSMSNFAVERLDHLGIVAGVCQEIGLVEYFDRLDEQAHARVSLGQAVLAMVLNGLGFSNRRLYLVRQFFEHKPIERLIGPGITPEDLNDDCLGRTLDWLTAHDLTALFAGLTHQARRRFAVAVEVVHVDSTSFSVEGAYESEEEDANETLIRITYGYSREHRADLKQWQLSLATTTSGIPLGLQLLDGNASDRATLAQQAAEVVYQFRAEHEEEPIYVSDSAIYSEATMTELDEKGVWWVGRVPETSTQAKALVAEEPATWQGNEELRWVEREVPIGTRTERWILAQSAEGVERQEATLQRRAEQDRHLWSKRLRALEQRAFACEADAQAACSEASKGVPPGWNSPSRWRSALSMLGEVARRLSQCRSRSGASMARSASRKLPSRWKPGAKPN